MNKRTILNQAIIIILLLLTHFSSYSEELLTKSSVSKFGDEIINVFTKKDFEKLRHYISDDANFIIEVYSSTDQRKLVFNKNEYLEFIKMGWEGTGEYVCTVNDRKIAISKDKKSAEVTENLKEEGEYNGQRVKSFSLSTWVVEIIEGKLVLKSSYNKTKI